MATDQMQLVVTAAGMAEVINAEQSGTEKVILTEVGFGSGKYTPSAGRTELNSEFKRLSGVAGGGIGDNLIHLTVQDDSGDIYTVYEIGIYTSTGTLFAVYSQQEPIVQKAGSASLLMALDILLSNINPESVTFGDTSFVLSPATTEHAGIVELATDAETATGTDTERAVTPKALSARTATTGRTGLVELATNSETIAGTDANRVITPASLAAAFVKQHTDSGYQKLPNGLIIQWGIALIANGANGTNIVFPTAFQNGCKSVSAVSAGTVTVSYRTSVATAGGVVLRHNGNGGVNTYWLAIGY